MNSRDRSRAEELEQRLRRSRSPKERQELFEELSKIYATDLQATALKWAHFRRTPNPVQDGPMAHANAFILLAEKLPELSLEENSLKFLYKGRIWSELGHRETRRRRRIKRSVTLEDNFDRPDNRSRGAEERLVAQEDLRRLMEYIKTPAKLRIFRGGVLKTEGHSWKEAARKIEWSGTPESLRVSFSKLRKELLDLDIHPGRDHS